MNKELNRGITLIALVVTIVVLLILAGVSIGMLTGENGIIKQAQDSKEKTDQAKVEELVTLAVNSLIGENFGQTTGITPQMVADEVNEMENRNDVKAEENTFPTKIIFAIEKREVGINIDFSVGEIDSYDGIYSEPGLEGQISPMDLFDYEIINSGENANISMGELSNKTVKILRVKSKYCNGSYTGYNPENDSYDLENTYYEIKYNGNKINTLVVPYEVDGKYIENGIEGEKYTVTEVSLYAFGVLDDEHPGVSLPEVETIIYPNTVEKIVGGNSNAEYGNQSLKKVVLSNKITEIEKGLFCGCISLTNITIPKSVINIDRMAFAYCISLKKMVIPDTVKTMREDAFEGCTDLELTIPETVEILRDM